MSTPISPPPIHVGLQCLLLGVTVLSYLVATFSEDLLFLWAIGGMAQFILASMQILTAFYQGFFQDHGPSKDFLGVVLVYVLIICGLVTFFPALPGSHLLLLVLLLPLVLSLYFLFFLYGFKNLFWEESDLLDDDF